MENQQSETAAGVSDGGAINKVKSEAAAVAQDVKRQGQEQFEARKQTAANQTEKLAGVVDRISEELKDQNQESLADYAGQLAGSMKDFAESLRQRNQQSDAFLNGECSRWHSAFEVSEGIDPA
ncbi:MAG: hypothetical protein K0Q83_264 [Deltaproteobacteria bacterium]|nr:hypothetical protein [Deltaproteobacteria bacterium]